jgi:adenine-specific DNA-methyltransferase
MQSKDGATERLRLFRQLFPEALTESIDEEGNVLPAIDADKLSQLLASCVVEGKDERYQFTWPDKRKAIRSANVPITSCLRPCRKESVNFDTTQNLYLEGDNLEVLKVLRESYLGKAKVIYIDPPYNTGNDFVYNDDFTQDLDKYKGNSGQQDEQGNRLVQNTEANGRYHTDWLNMMYPRLKVARDFLSDDGVIFISIDDNEVTNLRRICDEIFGESNFVTTIHCQMSTTQGMKVKAAQNGNIVKNSEYIICYSKNGEKNIAKHPLYDLRPEYDNHYCLYLKDDGRIVNISELYDYRFPKDLSNKKPLKLSEAFKRSSEFADIVRSHLADIVRSDKVTGFDIGDGLRNGYWKQVVRGDREYLLTKDKKGTVCQLLRLKDSWGKTDGFYGEEGLRKIRGDWWEGFYIDMGNVSKEGGVAFKNGKKPVRLIKQLISMVADKNDLIIDFFSGSATTAHAVMQLNAEDDGSRRFIMVQLPEICDEKSEPFKAGFKNICELGKERIRRAGRSIQEDTGKDLDIGFRVLKCDSSNMADVFYNPDDIAMDPELLQVDNIKADRTADDLLFQIMPELNIPLSASVETIELGGRSVYQVQDGYLLAVLEEGAMSDEFMRLLAEQHAPIIATRNSCLGTDADAINLEQYMRSISPETQIHIL